MQVRFYSCPLEELLSEEIQHVYVVGLGVMNHHRGQKDN